MPTVAVDPTGEAALHLLAIFASDLTGVKPATRIQRDDGRADAQLFPAEPVMRFGIIRFVGEHTVPVHDLRGLTHGLGKERRIVARPSAHDSPGPQMRAGMAHDRQFGPEPLGKRLLPAAAGVVAADVADLETRGIDGPLRALVDQAEFTSPSENGRLEAIKSPFFSRRFSA